MPCRVKPSDSPEPISFKSNNCVRLEGCEKESCDEKSLVSFDNVLAEEDVKKHLKSARNEEKGKLFS